MMSLSEPSERGTVYVVVLATLSIVFTIGMSSLLNARTELGSASRTSDEVNARLAARAGIEEAVRHMIENPGWRGSISGGVVLEKVAFGSSRFSVLASDPVDGDLQNRYSDPVELTAVGSARSAVQKYRYRVEYATRHDIPTEPILSMHPIGYWTLRDFTGTSVPDQRGGDSATANGKIAINAQDPTGNWNTPQMNSVDRTSFTIRHHGSMETDFGSLAFWVQPASSHTGSSVIQMMVDKYRFASPDQTSFVVMSNLGTAWLAIDQGDSVSYRQIGALTGDQWHHIAVTWGSDGWRVYLDGQPTGHLNRTLGLGRAWSPSANQADITLGASPSFNRRLGGSSAETFYLQGKLADFAMFAYVLTDKQIEQLAAHRPTPLQLRVVRDSITRLVD